MTWFPARRGPRPPSRHDPRPFAGHPSGHPAGPSAAPSASPPAGRSRRSSATPSSGLSSALSGRVVLVVAALVVTGAVAAVLVLGGTPGRGEQGPVAAGLPAPVSAAAGRPAASAPRGTGGIDVHRGLPAVTPSASAGVGYAPAPASSRRLFAPVLKASGGLLASSAVRDVVVGNRVVAAVAVYGSATELGRGAVFQDQFVIQLLQSMTTEKVTPRFVRIGDRIVALSPGKVPMAGWFEGGRVVLVRSRATAPDLPGLVAGVVGRPQGR